MHCCYSRTDASADTGTCHHHAYHAITVGCANARANHNNHHHHHHHHIFFFRQQHFDNIVVPWCMPARRILLLAVPGRDQRHIGCMY
jgi:hypothetical protein